MNLKVIIAKVFEKLFVHPSGALKEIVFSEKDHFPHRQFPVEWWYFTGFLSENPLKGNISNSSGNMDNKLIDEYSFSLRQYEYAFEVTFFRAKRPFEGHMLHIALYKLNKAEKGGQFLYGEKVSLCTIGERKLTGGEKVICVKDSYLAFNKSKNAFTCDVSVPAKTNTRSGDKRALHLKLEMSLHSMMLQGKNGLMPMVHGEGGASYYFTYPDVSVKGTVSDGENVSNVEGTAWHDHQFGDFTVFDSAWDWFSLRFEKQKIYVMVFGFRKIPVFHFGGNILRKKSAFYGNGKTMPRGESAPHSKNTPHEENTPHEGNTLHFRTTAKKRHIKNEYITMGNIFKDGKSIMLDDVRITAEKSFTLSSGVEYPLVFRISVLKNGVEVMRFRTEPLIKDCEFRSEFAPHYWEGPCAVSGEILVPFEQGGVHFTREVLNGSAFVELVGYAR